MTLPAWTAVQERKAIRVLRAEHELEVIEILADHAVLARTARARIARAVKCIRRALQVQRRKLGLRRRGAA